MKDYGKSTKCEAEYFFATCENEDEAIFKCLKAGIPVSMIPPIRDFDSSEVIALLCEYINNGGF